MDDAIEDIQRLVDKLGEIPDSQSPKIDIIVNDTEIDTLNTSMAGIEDKQVDFTVNADSGSLDKVETDATEASNAVEDISQSAVDAQAGLDSIDPTVLNEAASAANSLGGALEESAGDAGNYANETGKAEQSTSALGGALSGVAALGLGAFFSSAVEGAGQYETSWSRLALAVGQGGVAIGQVQADWETSIDAMKDSTGRGAGTIRGYITQMGIAGVTSKEAIVASFNGVAGAAYVTGQSVESVTNAFQRVVSTGTLGTRQLMALGLNSSDIYRITGMSIEDVNAKLETMDANQRAAFLSQIMNAKYGQDANEAYKQSWDYVVEVLGRAYDYLSRVIGGLLLPVAIPALEAASWVLEQLAGWIDGLDGPMKSVASVVAVLVAGFLLFVTTAGAIKTVLDILNIQWVLQKLGIMSSAEAKAVDTAATEANTAATNTGLVAKVRELATWVSSTASRVAHAIATGAATAAQVAYSVAAGVATAAQWLLNAALNANPIGIVVLAIVALIGALIWLYQNNEWVRNGINWLWAALQGLGAYIMNGLAPILQFFTQLWNDPIGAITNLGQVIQNLVVNALMLFMNLHLQLGQILLQIGQTAYNTLSQWFGQIPDMLWNFLLQALANFLNFNNEAARYALDAGKGVLDNIVWYLQDLPETVMNWFFKTLDNISKFAEEAFNRAKKTGENIWNGIINTVKNLPGEMFKYGQNILQGLIDGLKDKMGPFKDILNFISDHWPKSPPKTGPLSEVKPEGMRSWVGNIMDAGMDAVGNFNLNSIGTALPNISGANIPRGAVSGGNSIQVNVNMDKVNIASDLDARKIGETIGDSASDRLADRLKRQASNQGYSVTNGRR